MGLRLDITRYFCEVPNLSECRRAEVAARDGRMMGLNDHVTTSDAMLFVTL